MDVRAVHHRGHCVQRDAVGRDPGVRCLRTPLGDHAAFASTAYHGSFAPKTACPPALRQSMGCRSSTSTGCNSALRISASDHPRRRRTARMSGCIARSSDRRSNPCARPARRSSALRCVPARVQRGTAARSSRATHARRTVDRLEATLSRAAPDARIPWPLPCEDDHDGRHFPLWQAADLRRQRPHQPTHRSGGNRRRRMVHHLHSVLLATLDERDYIIQS